MDKQPNTLRGLPSPDSLFDEVCASLDGKFRCWTRGSEPNVNQRLTKLLRDRLAEIAGRHNLQQLELPPDKTNARIELQWKRKDNVVAELGWEWESDGVAILGKIAGSDAALKVYMTDCAEYAVKSQIKKVCRAVAEGQCTGDTLIIVFTAARKFLNAGKVCWAHKVVIRQQARSIARQAT